MSRELKRDISVREYALTLIDGSPLPEWLTIDEAGGLITGQHSVGIETIQLRLEITLTDDTLIVRYINVDVTSGEISALQDVNKDYVAGTSLFSNQIDDLPDVFH